MNKQILGLLLVLGLMLASQVSVAGDAMTEDKANVSAMSGGSGESDYMGTCLPCHGMEGKGDGPLSEDLGNTMPRDLSDAEYMSTRSDEQLFNVIKNGGKSSGFSDAMPDWGYNFSDDQIKSLVQYIRSDLCKCKGAK